MQPDYPLIGSGALSFIETADFENPVDANGDNLYKISVRVSDGYHTTDQDFAITVTNAEETPTDLILQYPDSRGGTEAMIFNALQDMDSVPVLTNTSPFHSSSSHPATFYGDWFYSKGKISEDGLNWQSINLNYRYWLNSIEYVNGQYLVTGPQGQLFTSQNGKDYTQRQTPDTDDLTSITFGNDVYVVRKYWQAGKVITSSDGGATWTTRSTGSQGTPDKTYNSVVFGNGVFVFSAKEGVRVSSDGVNWNYHATTNPIPPVG